MQGVSGGISGMPLADSGNADAMGCDSWRRVAAGGVL